MPLEALPPRPGHGMTAEFNLENFHQTIDVEPQEPRPLRTLPAEWAPQSAILISWPHAETDWADILDEVTECYVRMAYAIAAHQPLIVLVVEGLDVSSLLEKRLPQAVFSNITFVVVPKTNDTWVRDYGFLTVQSTGGAELMDFRFNGWGGKFKAEHDNAANRLLFEAQLLRGHYVDALDFELEGGGIESDGCGTLLTTTECLLNPNRRRQGDAVPTPDKAQVEALLKERLGVERILWLHHGYLAGDDTDSHIDTLARLCPNDTIIYVQCTDTADEHYEALAAMEQELQAFRTLEGKPYRLIPVPLPDACYDEEERLPATYANFLIMNKVVLVPTYAQPEKDALALKNIQKAFPEREIIGHRLSCSHSSTRIFALRHYAVSTRSVPHSSAITPNLFLKRSALQIIS